MSCDSFKNCIPNFYEDNHQILKLLSKCASMEIFWRPCYTANEHMFNLYLDPKSFFKFIWLKLYLECTGFYMYTKFP